MRAGGLIPRLLTRGTQIQRLLGGAFPGRTARGLRSLAGEAAGRASKGRDDLRPDGNHAQKQRQRGERGGFFNDSPDHDPTPKQQEQDMNIVHAMFQSQGLSDQVEMAPCRGSDAQAAVPCPVPNGTPATGGQRRHQRRLALLFRPVLSGLFWPLP